MHSDTFRHFSSPLSCTTAVETFSDPAKDTDLDTFRDWDPQSNQMFLAKLSAFVSQSIKSFCFIHRTWPDAMKWLDSGAPTIRVDNRTENMEKLGTDSNFGYFAYSLLY